MEEGRFCQQWRSEICYLQGKLDEERVFYENQLESSESSFKDLEAKMKEYEELLLKTGTCGTNRNPLYTKLV